MDVAKLSTDGACQTVILPEQFHLSGNEVCVKKVGNAIVLIAKDAPWQSLFDSLDRCSGDFMERRVQLDCQPRHVTLAVGNDDD